LEAFGVKQFSPTSELTELPLIDVYRQRSGASSPARTWSSLEELFNTLKQDFISLEKNDPILPGLQFAENLFADFSKMQIPQVFLKQSRSMVDGLKADYQAVIKSPARINALRSINELPGYSVTIHHQDSYPIFDDLGIKSQQSLMSFEIKMDFTIEQGQTLWESPNAGMGCGCSPLGWLFGKR
jgi:hypothetical protein